MTAAQAGPDVTTSADPSRARAGVAVVFRLALGTLFIAGVAAYGSLRGSGPDAMVLAGAAGVAAYMAINIGANDVANNVGPAVGANVLTLGAALTIAAIFEAAGALIAGSSVVRAIRSDIIDLARIPSSGVLVWLMMAAMLAAAVWVNIASAMRVPIATTHAIIGGVLGAGVAAGGLDAVKWNSMGPIAAGWVISPVLGGLIAAALLYLIKRTITYQRDMVRAARTYVPLLVAIMAWSFSTYLLVKGIGRIWPHGLLMAALVGLAVSAVVLYGVRQVVSRHADTLEDSKPNVNRLFRPSLIFSVALLCFAHGANDVANAIGPLAAILDVLSRGDEVSNGSPIPFWVMATGAVGIALGLALFGPRVIRTVSTEITALDPMRAYSIATATALTVIIASQLGLPVSTTHVAVGAIFGVGLLREYLKYNYQKIVDVVRAHHAPADEAGYKAFMERFTAATIGERGRMLTVLKRDFRHRMGLDDLATISRKKPSVKRLEDLVKRSLMYRILLAWLITVPASAALAALLFAVLRAIPL